jgi:reversibly glycosylated polypeptide/UDP-arabinopyranose mutase
MILSEELAMKMNILVVPTIRKNNLDRLLKEWGECGQLEKFSDIIIMEDNPTRTFNVHDIPNLSYHLSWDDIDRSLDSWIIPRRSDTVRSYAYKIAHDRAKSMHGDDVVIFTLDDDCYPTSKKFSAGSVDIIDGHRQALGTRSRWFNTLNSGKPRGIPFYNLGSREIGINHGLWTNVLDFDAPTQLAGQFEEEFSWDNRIVPSGQYFPMCGMNVAWRPDLTVLMYHLLMGCITIDYMPSRHAKNVRANCKQITVDTRSIGSPVIYKLPFDRFGDIWCGILMKKVVDHLRIAVSTGTPYIKHDRASDPFTNLIKEAEGTRVNEKFWELVDSMKLFGTTPASCYYELGSQMKLAFECDEHAWYFDMLGDAMMLWARMFEET